MLSVSFFGRLRGTIMEFAECSFVREKLSGDVYLVVEPHPLLDPSFIRAYRREWEKCLLAIPGVSLIEGRQMVNVPAGSQVAFIGYQKDGNPVAANGKILDGGRWRLFGVQTPLPIPDSQMQAHIDSLEDRVESDRLKADRAIDDWADKAEEAERLLRDARTKIDDINETMTHGVVSVGVFYIPGTNLYAFNPKLTTEFSYYRLRISTDAGLLYFPHDQFWQTMIASEIGYQQGTPDFQGFVSGGVATLPTTPPAFFLDSLDTEEQGIVDLMPVSATEEPITMIGPQVSIGFEQSQGFALKVQGCWLVGTNHWIRLNRYTFQASVGFRL